MMVPVGLLVVLRTRQGRPHEGRRVPDLAGARRTRDRSGSGWVLSTYASWRWIFLINVPLGLVALALASRLIPDVRGPDAAQLDWRGFGLTAIGVTALVVGIETVGSADPDYPLVATASVLLRAITISAACLVGMALLAAGTPLPLLVALLALSGTVRSIGFSACNSSAFAGVEPERMTKANALMLTLQELGAGLGVAVGALLVRVGGPLQARPAWATAPTERSASHSCFWPRF
jgi:predicted MFS family arabinose efflux permease